MQRGGSHSIGGMKMRLLKSRKALSTVVTSLIILVVSVLLATVVTLYAINVTTTRVQEESLLMQKVHIWYDADPGYAVAAFVLINTGGRDVVIDKIAVRGQETPWSNVYYNVTTDAIDNDLSPNSTALASGVTLHTEDGTSYTASVASTDLTLESGYTMIIYIDSPDSVTLSDVGTTIGITVHTMRAQYYKECNVEAVE
jgi:hypothetical protein